MEWEGDLEQWSIDVVFAKAKQVEEEQNHPSRAAGSHQVAIM